MKSLYFLIPLLFGFLKMDGQTYEDKERTIRKVFDRLVEAYGNARSAPILELLHNDRDERVVAQYSSKERPTIKIDEELVDICLRLKKDSLNALAIILSHELAHYYNNHSFCIDFAYAAGPKSRLSRVLLNKNALVVNKFVNESNADYEGTWHAAIAGYNPFDVFEKMIDIIYREYKLNGSTNGYPSKKQRKEINISAQQKSAALLPTFKAGIILAKIGMYKESSACFGDVALTFPSRENYYNAGVTMLLQALSLKSKTVFEFIYPFELDPVSRLRDYSTRGVNEENGNINSLLQNAKKNLKLAIDLDPSYVDAAIAYACAWEIEGITDAAIGELSKIPVKNNKVNLAYAIAYFNKGDSALAARHFNSLSFGKDSIVNYDLKIYQLRDQPNGKMKSQFTQGWKERNRKNDTDVSEIMKTHFQTSKQKLEPARKITGEEKISVINNKEMTAIEIYINNKKLLRAVIWSYYDCSSKMIIKINEDWLKKQHGIKETWWIVEF